VTFPSTFPSDPLIGAAVLVGLAVAIFVMGLALALRPVRYRTGEPRGPDVPEQSGDDQREQADLLAVMRATEVRIDRANERTRAAVDSISQAPIG
jgi:hypothetical protein